MKKIALLLFSLAITVVLPGRALAYNKFIADVNDSCGYEVIADCFGCHTSTYSDPTDQKDLYLSEGACGFCPENDACNSAPPTVEELYAEARGVNKGYFEALFGHFMTHLQNAANDPNGSGDPFADVFPACPELAPVIASDFSRLTGNLVRRVTERTRNQRNIPDAWELEQLKNFTTAAANGDPRVLMDIDKPDGSGILPTMEFEAYDVVTEEHGRGKNKTSQSYFRFMRSITMPPMPVDPPVAGNPNLPCLLCHGTDDQVSQGVKDAVAEFYPFDTAMGYKAGDIRGAWTIKIPLLAVPE